MGGGVVGIIEDVGVCVLVAVVLVVLGDRRRHEVNVCLVRSWSLSCRSAGKDPQVYCTELAVDVPRGLGSCDYCQPGLV